MDADTELGQIMQSIAEISLRLLANIKSHPEQLSASVEKLMDLITNIQTILSILFNNPETLRQTQTDYWDKSLQLLQNQIHQWLEGTSIPIADKRFNHKAWINNPFFNLLSQHYLLAANQFNSLLENLDYEDKQSAKRLKFFMRQYLDALSPDNFLYTNPQLIAETIESNGKNLLCGLHNLLTDIEAGSSQLMIKMTDTNAFKLGVTIAVTPGKVVFKNELMELIQYTPKTKQVNSVPLLIIPPWINKYYILDLSPENSMVRWLVAQGFTVFIISWVNPDSRYANKGLENYLNEGPITAIKIIQDQLNVAQVNALGFCLGGTLLAMLLAYYKAQNKQPVRAASFLAAMIDFSEPGDMSVFIDEAQIVKLEELMSTKGYLEGQFMANAFNSLRSSDLIWSFFIKNYLRGQSPAPFDILYWNGDATNMPARMHSEYVRWMYLQNDLIKPGKIHLNNTPLDVSKIDIPTFYVATKKDHIAPWHTIFLGLQQIGGEKHFILGESGHIAGIINPPGREKYGFYRNSQSGETSDNWLANATYHSGSWWPEWVGWLRKESGDLIDAPNFTNLFYKKLNDAPGSYVHMDAKLQLNELESTPA